MFLKELTSEKVSPQPLRGKFESFHMKSLNQFFYYFTVTFMITNQMKRSGVYGGENYSLY